MIASALENLPALDRKAQAGERFPYNAVASSEAMQRTMMRIVRGRLPGSPWADACAALIRTDESGTGFAEFLDAVRDVAFLAGVEYAHRSLPAWWSSYVSLDDGARQMFGWMIASAADKDGE